VLLLWGHHCCGEGEKGEETQNFCTFCECHLGVVGVVEDHIVVVVVQWKGKLLVGIAGGGGGVMVIFAAAFGFCYSCATFRNPHKMQTRT